MLPKRDHLGRILCPSSTGTRWTNPSANGRSSLTTSRAFYCIVSGDSSVSLHTHILIVYNIYIFFVSIYIKSLRSNARPDQGKSALVCTLIGFAPTNSRQKCRLKDVIYAGSN